MLSFATILLSLGASASEKPRDISLVVLDGVQVAVEWDDGDTFKVPESGLSARLMGYNTLESYGPVHRFGPGEDALYRVAIAATEMARSKKWECNVVPGDGGYGRKTVDCPQLRKALLEAGLAHPFSVDGPAPAVDLAAQKVAIDGGLGMWQKGPVKSMITSLHSMDEKRSMEKKSAYNRVLDVRSGQASPRIHTEVYAVCSWVCQGESCMLYVPYAQRYGENRADCLKPTP